MMKGILVLFLASSFFLTLSILIQSCSKNDSFVEERSSLVTENLKAFSQALKSSTENIKNVTSLTTNPTQIGVQIIEDLDYPALSLLRS